MKKIIFSLLGVATLLSSCEDRLNIPQKGVIAYDTFYKTDADAENALVNVYQCIGLHLAGHDGTYISIPTTILWNEPGDDMLAAGNFYGDNDFAGCINEFRYDIHNSIINAAYKGYYALVYDCNLILDNMTPDSPVKKRVIAEARTFRAYAHMMLAIGWKNPPIVDHKLDAAALPTNSESQEAVLEWAAKECEAVAEELPERTSPTDKAGAAKATKALAYTVAGKARLFLGQHDKAKLHFKKVIDSKKYELVPGEKWNTLFHTSGDLCEEMIFQFNHVDNPNVGFGGAIGRTGWMHNQYWNWRTDKLARRPTFIGCDGWGGCSIRPDFAEKFLANDGDSHRRKASFLTGEEFLYGIDWGVKDADGNPVTDKAILETSKEIGIKDQIGLYGFGNYFVTKNIATPEDCPRGNWGYKNYTFFRYAEVLLMYAEACAQTGDNDGLQYLQAIQKRAGSKHISTALTLDEVKAEKSYEMFLEGVRFADMVRWGDTKGIENNGKNIPSTYDAFFTKGEAKHRLYVEYSNPNIGKTGFVKGKHEYFPFPFATVSVNPNIKQNPSGL